VRRQFELPEEDEECLAANGHQWEAIIEGNVKWVLVPDYPVPQQYTHESVIAALRIPPSYPDDQIDMVYFYPPLVLKTGKPIGALSHQHLDEKTFQRWSRHRTGTNPWRPGVDNICTHLLQVDSWLARECQ
jgi:hypothetical protein